VILDQPVYASLTGPHAHFAERHGTVLRYPADVAPFIALPDGSARSWADLGELVGPGGTAVVAAIEMPVPAEWEIVAEIPGVQLVDDGMTAVADPEAVPLGSADVPEMLELVARTRPGPFLPRTVELGRYLGIRRDGALIAMAGERLHPPGYTELSAVCTDDAYRGQGLATRLIRAVAAGIRERGETPFLHAAASNTTAVRLYEQLGFRLRRKVTFLAVKAPTTSETPATR
jgi:ribosomal protein S18 acetylase RimI-like enzyme